MLHRGSAEGRVRGALLPRRAAAQRHLLPASVSDSAGENLNVFCICTQIRCANLIWQSEGSSSRGDEDVYEAQDGCTTLLELTRSEAWCEGNTRVRHQFNGITAFVDGSGVYGSDDETAHSLRGTQGKMLTFDGKLPVSARGNASDAPKYLK